MSTYTEHSSYVLEELTLKHAQGDLDLSANFISLSLFESVEDIGMSGQLIIPDSYNLSDIAPFYGYEEIIISFYTSGNEDNPIEYSGRIYKISEKHRISEHTSGYSLFFCSDIMITSKRSYVLSGYNDTISNAVSSIHNTFNNSDKPFLITETQGTFTYSFGHVDPLEAIQIMKPKALSINGDLGYLYFENNQEWIFKPIEELYQQEVLANYGSRSAGVSQDINNRFAEQFESIQDIKIYEENSYMDRLNDGIHGSDHYYFDIFNKRYYDNYTYNRNNEYNSNRSLGESSSKLDVDMSHDITFLTFGSSEQETANYKAFSQSRMRLRESDMFRAEMTVMGDSKLKCGAILDVVFPNWNQDQENVGTLFDGKVFIKKINHMLTQSQYMQVLMVSKDAYNEDSI